MKISCCGLGMQGTKPEGELGRDIARLQSGRILSDMVNRTVQITLMNIMIPVSIPHGYYE